jgi:thiosulfate/3-mercaptopyruvate sulfurtransferase
MRMIIIFLLVLAAVEAADMPLTQPADVSAALTGKSKPMVLQVGPNVLYRSKHIPGAIYAGMGARPEGLELLKKTVDTVPRDREIVIYCGCCPWDHCPNIRPAMELLHGMGFAHVKAMFLPTDFKVDWIDKGYPVEAGAR